MTIIRNRVVYAASSVCGTYYVCGRLNNSENSPFRKLWRMGLDSPATSSLAALNVLVFALSRRLRPQGLFFNSPFNPAPSLTFSCFNHANITHLSMNMLGLISFGPIVERCMGPEQFFAFYVSCGTLSSLGSVLYKLRTRSFIPSVGASGAVYGVLGACVHQPDVHVGTIFVPGLDLPISQAFPLLIGFDIFGLIRGGSGFDHMAHLSGGALGYFGFKWSQSAWDRIIKKNKR